MGLLSGGEAARLIFALLVVEKPNVLVLDEPTNHLDLEAITPWSRRSRRTPARVLFVSHDRWFVSELGTRIIELTPAGIRDFPGTYAEYVAALRRRSPRRRHGRAQGQAGRQGQPRQRRELTELGGTEAAPQPAGQAARRTRPGAPRDSRPPRAGRRPSTSSTAAPASSSSTAPEAVQALEQEKVDLGQRLESLLTEWETLEQQIEALERRVSRPGASGQLRPDERAVGLAALCAVLVVGGIPEHDPAESRRCP